jgi:hypothetical protein
LNEFVVPAIRRKAARSERVARRREIAKRERAARGEDAPDKATLAAEDEDTDVLETATRLSVDLHEFVAKAATRLRALPGGGTEGFVTTTIIQRLYRREQELIDDDLYDAASLADWASIAQQALDRLELSIDELRALGGENAGTARELETQRSRLEKRVRAFQRLPFVRSGHAIAERREGASRRERQVDSAVARLHVAADESGGFTGGFAGQRTKAGVGIGGMTVAKSLEHLPPDVIQEAFARMQEEDPEAFARAMHSGQTIIELQERGVKGLAGFATEGQDLLEGLVIGLREAELTRPNQPPVFDAVEMIGVTAGFVAGVPQGIIEAFVDNLEFIASLFTREFWVELADAVTKLLASESFRRDVGTAMAELMYTEIEELNASEPFAYGRTIGRWSGMLVFEIAVAFLTGGAVTAVRAGKAAKLLSRLEAVTRLARRTSRVALARGGLRVLRVIHNAADLVLTAIDNALAEVRQLLPKLSSSAKASGEITTLTRAERLQELADKARSAAGAVSDLRHVGTDGMEALQKAVANANEALKDLEKELRLLGAKGVEQFDRAGAALIGSGGPPSGGLQPAFAMGGTSTTDVADLPDLTVAEMRGTGGGRSSHEPGSTPPLDEQVAEEFEAAQALSREPDFADGPQEEAINVRGKFRADPEHHGLPQEYRTFFKRHGVDVDDYVIEMPEWEHQALHGGGNWQLARREWEGEWNAQIMKRMKDEERLRAGKLNKARIERVLQQMMKDYGLAGRPLKRYSRARK